MEFSLALTPPFSDSEDDCFLPLGFTTTLFLLLRGGGTSVMVGWVLPSEGEELGLVTVMDFLKLFTA